MRLGEYQELESYLYSELEVFENTYTKTEVETKENEIKKYREMIEKSKHKSKELLGEIWFMVDYLSYPIWTDLLKQIRTTINMSYVVGSAKAMQSNSSKESKVLMTQMLDDDEKKLEHCKANIFAFMEKVGSEI